jgi:hypothetical protein
MTQLKGINTDIFCYAERRCKNAEDTANPKFHEVE